MDFKILPSGEKNVTHLFPASQTTKFPWASNDIPRGFFRAEPLRISSTHSPSSSKRNILLSSLFPTIILPVLSIHSPFGQLRKFCPKDLSNSPFSLNTTILLLSLSLTTNSPESVTVTPQGYLSLVSSVAAPSPIVLRDVKDLSLTSIGGNSWTFSPFTWTVNICFPGWFGMREIV